MYTVYATVMDLYQSTESLQVDENHFKRNTTMMCKGCSLLTCGYIVTETLVWALKHGHDYSTNAHSYVLEGSLLLYGIHFFSWTYINGHGVNCM